MVDDNDDTEESNENQRNPWYYAPIASLTQIKESVSNVISQAAEKLKQYKDIFDTLAATLKHLPPYLKLYITYFQITATYLTFAVKWPQLLQNMMLWLKSTIFLDILSLPGLNCLWQGIRFRHKLLIYTLVPLGGVVVLLIPVIYYCILDFFRPEIVKIKHRKMAAINSAWKNIIYVSFLIYPIVSLTTLQAFDCSPLGLNRLAADYNEPCPDNSSFLRVWSIIFIWIYPVGIPLFCYTAMLGMGVHLIAQDILNKELLHGLAVKYIQCTGKSSTKVLELFPSDKLEATENSTDYSKLIEDVFNCFVDEQGNVVETNRKFGDSDVDTELFCEFLKQHALAAQHSYSLDDFKKMLHYAFANKDLLANVTAGTITKEQAIALLSFDWKKNFENSMNLHDSGTALANGTRKSEVDSFQNLEKNKLDKQAEEVARNKREYFIYMTQNEPKKVGIQLLTLARDLKDDNIITARIVSWDESISELENEQGRSLPDHNQKHSMHRNLKEEYILHPELPDDHQWNSIETLQNLLGNLLYKVPDDWKCAKGRMKLKSIAINRLGFIFASYHAKFWFWELLEMLRK